jgi:hypothetical protein
VMNREILLGPSATVVALSLLRACGAYRSCFRIMIGRSG